MPTDLQQLTSATETLSVTGATGVAVGDIVYDSRQVRPGSLFVAVRGVAGDGHRHIPEAVAAGCVGVVAEELPDGVTAPVAWVHVRDSRRALAELAAAFYEHPSRSMAVVGVTGTNGKTTTVFLLHHLLQKAWLRCGMLGTLRYFDGVEASPASRTTPESRDVQALLGSMRDQGCRGAVMEVSSHALAQGRVHGVDFDVAVFTNLSQDHLDYHRDLQSYFEAKASLFDQLGSSRGGGGAAPAGEGQRGRQPAAVVNSDDAHGRRLVKRLGDRVATTTYGMGVHAGFRGLDRVSDFDGTRFKLKARGREFLVRIPLIGSFNVHNALAALAAGNALGINLRESVENLATAPQVPGRLESVTEGKPFRVFVDYAHTPDALENVLVTLRELEPRRLVTVFGCGGDRDRGKRPQMGAVAERYSDSCILTSDNPRSEPPAAILKEIAAGMSAGRNHQIIEDRQEAISAAVAAARAGDIVLIAGKGHETYQETSEGKQPFDDRQVAAWALGEWRNPRTEEAGGGGGEPGRPGRGGAGRKGGGQP